MFVKATPPNPDPATRRTPTNSGGRTLRQWIAAATRNWKRRKMAAAFYAMDDWVLRDIGLDRGDIDRLVDAFDDRELQMVPLARDVAATKTAQHFKNAV